MDSSLGAITLLVLLLLLPDGSRSLSTQEIFTPNTGEHTDYIGVDLDISSWTDVIFEVRACHDAHVLLMKDSHDEDNNVIETVIGGWDNTKSGIRTAKGQTPPETSVDNTPLDCGAFKTFWISWVDGIYTVGYGHIVGDNQFMQYESQSEPMVNAIAISTGWGSDGTWIFNAPTCAAAETVEYAYCKSAGSYKKCGVGLGDAKVTNVWSNSIISGECRQSDYGFHVNSSRIWVRNDCESVFGVCLANDCVGPSETRHCYIGQTNCNFSLGNDTLISVSKVPPTALCSSQGFSTKPPHYPTTASGIYGYDTDSMYIAGNCNGGMFEGCFLHDPGHTCSGGEMTTVSCTSPNNQYMACKVGDGNKIIRHAWLVTPSTPTQCNYFSGYYPFQGPGGAWGYHENILWTAEGCGGMFGVCLDLGCPGGKIATLNCSSTGNYTECTLPQASEYVILYSRLLRIDCITTCLNQGLGANDPSVHTHLGMYGWVYDKLWTNNGCGGVFQICYKDSCEVRGDPHIRSEDGKKYTYSGNCTYQLVADEDIGFYVYGDFFKCGHANQASCLSSLNIICGTHTVKLKRPGKIYVDGSLIPISSLPYTTPDGHVHIKAEGGLIRVELPNGVYIMWDQKKKADIYLPITFQGTKLGLCGTYDINIHNEFTLRNGQVVNDSTIFGDDWSVPGSC